MTHVRRGDRPLFTKHSGQSTKFEKFFVRSGNASREFDQLSEITLYIGKRFSQG